MAELMVINTGPLVALARAGAIGVMSQLPVTLVCPREVKEELDDGHV